MASCPSVRAERWGSRGHAPRVRRTPPASPAAGRRVDAPLEAPRELAHGRSMRRESRPAASARLLAGPSPGFGALGRHAARALGLGGTRSLVRAVELGPCALPRAADLRGRCTGALRRPLAARGRGSPRARPVRVRRGCAESGRRTCVRTVGGLPDGPQANGAKRPIGSSEAAPGRRCAAGAATRLARRARRPAPGRLGGERPRGRAARRRRGARGDQLSAATEAPDGRCGPGFE
jgi:hypothetical protein